MLKKGSGGCRMFRQYGYLIRGVRIERGLTGPSPYVPLLEWVVGLARVPVCGAFF